MGYYDLENEKQAVIQNLQDAGCDEETIRCFMKCFLDGKTCKEMDIINLHRRKLLEILHENQKKIDCLDYLVYQLKVKKIDQSN